MLGFIRGVVLTGAACGTLAGCTATIGDMDFTRSFATTVPAAGLNQLVIKGDNGDVIASAGDVAAIDIHARIEVNVASELHSDTVSVTRSSGTTTVATQCNHVGMVFWRLQNCGVDYTVTYPRSMQLSVTIANGDVTIDSAGAPVNAHTTNGDVTIRNARSDVVARSQEGDVTASLARGWTGNQIVMATTFGDVRFTIPNDFSGSVKAHTIFGDTEGLPVEGAGSPVAQLWTSFGDVEVRHKPS